LLYTLLKQRKIITKNYSSVGFSQNSPLNNQTIIPVGFSTLHSR